MSAPLPALIDISAGYLMGIQQADISGLYDILVEKESAVRAALQARIEEICNDLPQQLYDAAQSHKTYVTIFCVLRIDHSGLCADGTIRETNSEAFERYIQIDGSGSTVQEILASRISPSLTLNALPLNTSTYEYNFARRFIITWPSAMSPAMSAAAAASSSI